MKHLIILVVLLAGCSKNDNPVPSINGNWQFSISSQYTNVSGEFSIVDKKVTKGDFTIDGLKSVIDSVVVVGADIDLLAKKGYPMVSYVHLKGIKAADYFQSITADSVEYLNYFKQPGATIDQGKVNMNVTITRR